MPRAPKVCSHVDSSGACPNLQPCATHAKIPWQGSTRRTELPKDWARRRRVVLHRNELDNDGLCTDGRACGGEAFARDVHHLDAGGKHDHSYANLRAICAACHGAITCEQATEARRAGEVGQNDKSPT